MPDRQEHLWQEQARRLGGDDLVTTIETMGRDLGEIKESVNELNRTAFPGGDAEGHRRAHEIQIRKIEEMRRLRIAIQEKTLSGLIWALIVFLALCIFSYFGGKPPTIPPIGR